MLKYCIQMPEEKDIERTFEVMFAFGFVFTKNRRLKTYLEVKNSHSLFERGDWLWLIIGYDDCQNVFGVSQAFDRSIHEFYPIKLDDFLWSMFEMKQPALPIQEGSTPSEYFRFTPPV